MLASTNSAALQIIAVGSNGELVSHGRTMKKTHLKTLGASRSSESPRVGGDSVTQNVCPTPHSTDRSVGAIYMAPESGSKGWKKSSRTLKHRHKQRRQKLKTGQDFSFAKGKRVSDNINLCARCKRGRGCSDETKKREKEWGCGIIHEPKV